MAQSVVGVYNLACSAIGTRARIASPTEASREAEVCQDWYETVRDRVLTMAPWPEARATARLALRVARDDTADWVATDPSPSYLFSYNLPSDYLWPRYLSDYSGFQMEVTSGNTLALMSNMEEPILHYTKRQTDPTLWSPQLHMAIVYSLASFISMPLHGKSGRANIVMGQANQIITDARVLAANTDNTSLDTMPDWIAARGFSGSQYSRFFYPQAPAWSLGDLPRVI